MILKKTFIGFLFLTGIFVLSVDCSRAGDLFSEIDEELSREIKWLQSETEVSSTSRDLRPLSEVAENISVLTSVDIENMNVHNLSEALNVIPGVQIDRTFNMLYTNTTTIQGSSDRNILVLLDGVPLTDLYTNVANISWIPASIIDRIEVIKGPASSIWGSTIGGVINVFTKKPKRSEKPKLQLYSAGGEHKTLTSHIELSGNSEEIGYSIIAGDMRSDGRKAYRDYQENYLFLKLMHEVDEKTKILFSSVFEKSDRQAGTHIFPYLLRFRSKEQHLTASLSLERNISESQKMLFSLKGRDSKANLIMLDYQTGVGTSTSPLNERYLEGGFKYFWKDQINKVVVGGDISSEYFKQYAVGWVPPFHVNRYKWNVFANDTLRLGSWTIIPGLRFDHIGGEGDFFSPSLGATYKVNERTLLRAYVSKGFFVPLAGKHSIDKQLNLNVKPEVAYSYQIGAESSLWESLSVKLNVFLHDVYNNYDIWAIKPRQRAVRHGLEVGFETRPANDISVFADYSYAESKNLTTGQNEAGVVNHMFNVGMQYDDGESLKARVWGHSMEWNQPTTPGVYSKNAFQWNVNVNKRFNHFALASPEVFLTIHNIFSGEQFRINIMETPSRWLEIGCKLSF